MTTVYIFFFCNGWQWLSFTSRINMQHSWFMGQQSVWSLCLIDQLEPMAYTDLQWTLKSNNRPLTYDALLNMNYKKSLQYTFINVAMPYLRGILYMEPHLQTLHGFSCSLFGLEVYKSTKFFRQCSYTGHRAIPVKKQMSKLLLKVNSLCTCTM